MTTCQDRARTHTHKRCVSVFMLRHWRNWVVWGTHLCKDFIQPLQRPMQMHFNPAGGAGHILTVVFSSPALKEKTTGQVVILALQLTIKYLMQREQVIPPCVWEDLTWLAALSMEILSYLEKQCIANPSHLILTEHESKHSYALQKWISRFPTCTYLRFYTSKQTKLRITITGTKTAIK